MNKMNIPENDLENLLEQTLKDDLPPEAEARMNKHFISLKRSLDYPGESTGRDARCLWARGESRKKILAFASVAMLILGTVMHLSGNQGALANSISRLKIIVNISTSLYSATSMDCTVLIPNVRDKDSYYRVRWSLACATRVDMDSTNDAAQTLWVSNATMPPDPLWKPAMEYLTPTILAQQMEQRYGLMQAEPRNSAKPDELLLVGQEDQQIIEIAIDESTYLPQRLRKYLPDSGKAGGEWKCLMEARFLWNQPIPRELLIPRSHGAKPMGNL